MEFFSLKQSNVNGKGKQSHLNKFNFKNLSIKKHLKKKKKQKMNKQKTPEIYSLTVLEMTSPNTRCQQSHTNSKDSRGESTFAFSSFRWSQACLGLWLHLSGLCFCLHTAVCVCPVTLATGFSNQDELHALKPLVKITLALSSACPCCSALALTTQAGTTHPTPGPSSQGWPPAVTCTFSLFRVA